MKKTALTLALSFALAVPAAAQMVPEKSPDEAATLEEYIKLVRGDLGARRDSAVKALIQLNDAEAKAFGPLKEAYDKELNELGKRRQAVVDEYVKIHTKLTAESAAALAKKTNQVDMDRVALHQKYFDRMSKEVSPVVAVQFLQLQRQFETMGDLKLATRMPIAVK